jgi:hypothetical protein
VRETLDVAQQQPDPPEARGKGIDLGAELGLPAWIAQQEQRELTRQQLDRMLPLEQIHADPALTRFFSDLDHAVVAKDDLPGVIGIAREFRNLPPIESLGFQRGDFIPETPWGAYLAARAERGRNIAFELPRNTMPVIYSLLGLHELTDDERTRFDLIRQQQEPPLVRRSGLLAFSLGATAEQGPIMASSLLGGARQAVVRGAQGAVAGAGLGALGGSVIPFVGTAGGALAGARGGFSVGSRLGFYEGAARRTFEMEASSAFLEFLRLQDEEGKPISMRDAAVAATWVGGVNAGIELVTLKTLLNGLGLGDILRHQGQRAASLAVAKSFLKTVAGRRELLRRTGLILKAMGTEFGEEFTQETVQQQAARTLTGVGLGTPTKAELARSFEAGLQALASVGTIAATTNVAAVGSQRMARALEGHEGLQRWVGAMKRSKLPQRSEIATQRLLADLAEETGLREVGIPAERLQAAYEAQGLSPAELEADVPGLGPTFAAALAAGEDVVVPIARLHKVVERVGDPVLKDVRLDPGGLTAAEAEQLSEQEKAAVDELVAQLDKEIAENGIPSVVDPVEAAALELEAGITAAGGGQADAALAGAFFRAQALTEAARSGRPIETVVGETRLEVQAEGAPALDVPAEVAPERRELFQRKAVPGLTVEAAEARAPRPALKLPRTPSLVPVRRALDLGRMDDIARVHPDPLANEGAWHDFVRDITGESVRSVVPPARVVDPTQLEPIREARTPAQIEAADHGLATASKIGEAFRDGRLNEEDAGLLLVWTGLSAQLGPWEHEAGFLRGLENGLRQFVAQAALGRWSAADTTAGLAWTRQVLGKGTGAGAAAAANMNRIFRTMLPRLAATRIDGLPSLTWFAQALRDGVPSAEIRRRFLMETSDSGLGPKLFSFALLAAGRTDVVVLDRWQVRNLWGAAADVFDENADAHDAQVRERFKPKFAEARARKRNRAAAIAKVRKEYQRALAPRFYDALVSELDGPAMLAIYEAVERRLTPVAEAWYGRPEVGRLHWETWLVKAGQATAHPSLDVLVAGKVPAEGITIEQTDTRLKNRTGELVTIYPEGRAVYWVPTGQESPAYGAFTQEEYVALPGDAKRRRARAVARAHDGAPGALADLRGDGTAGPVRRRRALEDVARERREEVGPLDRRAGEALLEEGADPQAFFDAIGAAKAAHPFGASVTQYSVEDYREMRLFLAPDGLSGFALNGDDIVSAFKHPASTERTAVRRILRSAVAAGGRRLDAFDTVLPDLYSGLGFRAVARLAWNDRYAPGDWDYTRFEKYNRGRPDVVFMIYDPTHNQAYDRSATLVVGSYDEGTKRQRAALYKLPDRRGTPKAIPAETLDQAIRDTRSTPGGHFVDFPIDRQVVQRAWRANFDIERKHEAGRPIRGERFKVAIRKDGEIIVAKPGQKFHGELLGDSPNIDANEGFVDQLTGEFLNRAELEVLSRVSWLLEMSQEDFGRRVLSQPMVAEVEDYDTALIKAAIDAFGVTDDPREAGYILPDGQMLDFSGGQLGMRNMDHRQLGELEGWVDVGKGLKAGSGTEAMIEFMNRTHALRFDFSAGYAESQTGVYRAQIEKLQDLAAQLPRSSPEIMLEVSNRGGARLGSASMTTDTSAAAIRGFFAHPEMWEGTDFRRLSQPLPDDAARGRIEFANDLSEAMVIFTQRSDATTMIHELWHLYTERLLRKTLDPAADPQQVADAQTLLSAVGAANYAALTDAQREKLATWQEAYMMEGRAPSRQLEALFRRFRAWAIQIYKTVKALLGDDVLTDEVRDVFDRMLATDAEIAEMRMGKAQLQPITGIETLMTPQEVTSYGEAHDRAQVEAEQRLQREVMSAVRQRKTRDYKAAAARIHEEVTREVYGRREQRVRHLLRTGELPLGEPTPEHLQGFKLVRGELERRFPKTILRRLALERISVRERRALKAETFKPSQGVPIDVASSLLGYNSADEMVRAIAAAPDPVREINRLTRARVEQELGLAPTPDMIADAAAEAMYNEPRMTALHLEERVMAKRVGDQQPRAVLRVAAKRIAASFQIARLQPSRYRVMAEKHARLSVEAFAAGDFHQALAEKRRQILATYLEHEAYVARERLRLELAYVRGLRRASRREAIARSRGAHLPQIEHVLERFGLKRPTPERVGEVERTPLNEWLRENYEDVDIPAQVDVADFVRGNDDFMQDYRTMTVENWRRLVESLRWIETQALREATIQIENEAVDREQVVTQLVLDGERLKLAPDGGPALSESDREKTKRKYLDARAILRRPENLINLLAGGDIQSPWYQAVFLPLTKSSENYDEMSRAVGERVMETFRRYNRKTRKAYDNHIDESRLKMRDGRPFPMRKWDVVMILLNMGNTDNKQKLLDGYGWDEQTVRDVLDTWLTPDDIAFAQEIIDLTNSLWPEMVKLQRRVGGIVPPKIQPTPFVTQHGTLRGGYFPVVYNPLLPREDVRGVANRAARRNIINQAHRQVKATTAHGSLNARVVTAGPILLDIHVITSHLDSVIRDLAFREALENTHKLLNDNRVRAVLQERLGKAYGQKFWNDWLTDIAQTHVDSYPAVVAGRIFSSVRAMSSVFSLGYRATTLLMQPSGIINGYRELARHFPNTGRDEIARRVIAAMYESGYSPTGITQAAVQATRESRFMHSRINSMDASLRQAIEESRRPESGLLDRARVGAMHTIARVQYGLVDVPVYLATKSMAMETLGLSEAQAIQLAESVVRRSQGSGDPISISGVERNALLRQFAVFYSYFNTVYNQNADAWVGAANRGRWGQGFALGSSLLLTAILPQLMAEFLRELWQEVEGATIGKADTDEDEPWLTWAVRISSSALFGLVPGLRDLWSGYYYGSTDSTPLARAVKIMLAPAYSADNAVIDGEWQPFVFDVLRAGGFLSRLPVDYPLQIAEEALKED